MKDVYIVHTNIISNLGFDSATNMAQLSNGISGIQYHENSPLSPTPFHASLIDTDLLHRQFEKIGDPKDYTRLEQMMLLSLRDVIQSSSVELSEKTGLIISTTKGNIDTLCAQNDFPPKRAYLSELGKQIQDFFGFENEAIILSNACVSGILAVAIAKRLLQTEVYENVLIVSGDMVTEFVLSGFNSFQAISPKACQPFSKNRTGITIGEAAASVLLTSNKHTLTPNAIKVVGAASCNDANHISGPSRTGEGLYLSIQSALQDAQLQADAIDYISAHGTATLFNDEMESIAMNRANLETVPLNSLKGYYGHTLGSSGLVESIVGIHSLQNDTLYASLGFDELGVSQEINVLKETQTKPLKYFIKTASGFGGCNTAVIFAKATQKNKTLPSKTITNLNVSAYCRIVNNTLSVNGKIRYQEPSDLAFADFAKKLYKTHQIGYPKFFKMDKLSKLAFLGAEFLLRESENTGKDHQNIAIVLSNRASSLDTDRKHQAAIDDKENYFPSPAVFVYTLPNICIGEISIRHQLKSENAFFIFDAFKPDFLEKYSRTLLQQGKATQVLCGWVDMDGDEYNAFLYLLSEDGQWNYKQVLDEK